MQNYFIPCLNLQKIYGNFGKSSDISVNFRKLQKRFKPVIEELKRFMKILENFGSVRKFSENFGNGSKVIFRCFYDFLKFSENLRKSSEVFRNLRKRFPDVIGNLRNGS